MGIAEKNLRGRTVSSATRLICAFRPAETPQLNHPLLPSHHYPRVGLRPNQDLQICKHFGQLNFTINLLLKWDNRKSDSSPLLRVGTRKSQVSCRGIFNGAEIFLRPALKMNGLSALSLSLTAAARSSLGSGQLFQHDIRFTHSSDDDLLSGRRGPTLTNLYYKYV